MEQEVAGPPRRLRGLPRASHAPHAPLARSRNPHSWVGAKVWYVAARCTCLFFGWVCIGAISEIPHIRAPYDYSTSMLAPTCYTGLSKCLSPTPCTKRRDPARFSSTCGSSSRSEQWQCNTPGRTRGAAALTTTTSRLWCQEALLQRRRAVLERV